MRSAILAGVLAALAATEVSAFGVAKLPALRAIGLRNSPQLGRQSKVTFSFSSIKQRENQVATRMCGWDGSLEFVDTIMRNGTIQGLMWTLPSILLPCRMNLPDGDPGGRLIHFSAIKGPNLMLSHLAHG